MNTEKKIDITSIINARLDFNRVRTEDEENLLPFIEEYLKQIDISLYNHFVNDVSIQAIQDLNPVAQRVIINKYFNSLLLIFRTNYKCDISEILMYLVNDGSIDYWKTSYRDMVFPFIRNYKNNFKKVVS